MSKKPLGEGTQRQYESLAVLAYIAAYQQCHLYYSPSERAIQKDLGISAPWVVHLILQRLERAGLLIVTRYGRGQIPDLMLTHTGYNAAQLWQEEHTSFNESMVAVQRRAKRHFDQNRHKQVLRAGSGKHRRFRRAAIRQPTILLISSNLEVLTSTHTMLTEANFAVFATASPFNGYDYAVCTLGITLPSRATAMLIDTSNVYGVLVVAGLARRMQQRAIPPTWLIALLDTQEPERELEARLAGCQQVVHLPLTEDAIRSIQRQLKRLAPLPHSDTEPHATPVIKALQTIADRMLQAALEVQPDQWTDRDVACLLYQLTSYPLYPLPETTQEEQWMNIVDMNLRTEQIIRTLGGIQAAREFLVDCAHYLEPQYPVHSKILAKFLDGWQRKAIVRHFVEQRLYEDTRIYACIKELPQRISGMLKIQGE